MVDMRRKVGSRLTEGKKGSVMGVDSDSGNYHHLVSHQEYVSNNLGMDSETNSGAGAYELYSADPLHVKENKTSALYNDTGRSGISTTKDSHFNATSAMYCDTRSGIDGIFSSELDQTPVTRRSRLAGSDLKN